MHLVGTDSHDWTVLLVYFRHAKEVLSTKPGFIVSFIKVGEGYAILEIF